MHLATVPALIFALAMTFGIRVVLPQGAGYGFVTVVLGGGGAFILYAVFARSLRVRELTEVGRMVAAQLGSRLGGRGR
jgi:hypothetical protein